MLQVCVGQDGWVYRAWSVEQFRLGAAHQPDQIRTQVKCHPPRQNQVRHSCPQSTTL